MEMFVVLIVLWLLGGVVLLFVNIIAVNSCRRAVMDLNKRLELLERLEMFRRARPEPPSPPAPSEPARKPTPVLVPLPQEPEPAPPPALKPEPLPTATIPAAPDFPPKTAPLPQPERKPHPIPELAPTEFEQRAGQAMQRIWSWIIVGEEFRPQRVAVEYAVATVWLIRCAVLLLLIGIGFFIKYSHDNNLISPQTRIAGVILLGLGIVGIGCRLVKSERYRLLGYGLSGIGVVTLYFAVFAAASIYKFLPVMAAFPLMILITVFGALLALRQNSLFVALISVIGGYATPILLSTGAKQLPELFAYLVLIGAGALFLAFYRNWRLLNFVAFLLNYGIFLGAVHKFYDPLSQADFLQTIGFSSVLFVLFSLLPLLYSLVHRRKVTLLEVLLLAANAAFYLLTAVQAVEKSFPDSRYGAGVSLFAALVFAMEFLACVKFRVRDRNLYLALLVFCSFATALTFPLLLSGHWIVTAWALQAAAMLYLGTRSGSRFLMTLSYALYAVAIFYALFLLINAITAPYATYWKGMLDRLVLLGSCVLSLGAGYCILKYSGADCRRPEVVGANEPNPFSRSQNNEVINLFLWGVAIFTFLLLRIEIAKFPTSVSVLRITLCAALYLGVLEFLFNRCRFSENMALRGWMTALAIAAGADLVRLVFFVQKRAYPVDCGFRLAAFLIFCAGLALIAKQLRLRSEEPHSLAGFFAAAGGLLWFAYSSAELSRGLSLYVPGFSAGGLTVLWAIYALLLLICGIRFRRKAMRYCGLCLFAVVALKALLLDMARLPSLYRVLAFLAIGLLFFIGAFAYMRVEQLFSPAQAEDEESKKAEK